MAQLSLPDFEHKKNFYFSSKNLLLYRLLVGGTFLSQAARAAGMSKQLARYYALKWEKAGYIQRIAKYPALYSKGAKSPQDKVKKVSRYQREPTRGRCLFLPHRFSVSFLLRRKPKAVHGFDRVVRVRNWRQFVWYEDEFTLVLYPNRLKVWLYRHGGKSVAEVLARGVELCRERVKAFEREQGCSLCDGELDERLVEWVHRDKALSDRIRALLRLDVAPVVVNEARWLVDGSHPDLVEVNGRGATDSVRLFEWWMREAPGALAEGAKQRVELAEGVAELSRQVSDMVFLLKERGRRV